MLLALKSPISVKVRSWNRGDSYKEILVERTSQNEFRPNSKGYGDDRISIKIALKSDLCQNSKWSRHQNTTNLSLL